MTDTSTPPKQPFSKGDFYKLCREWHGYLSALAFIALIFFSGTGILLNHPGLLGGEAPAPLEETFKLDTAQIAAVKAAAVPGEELAKIAGAKFPLAGAYSDGEVAGDDVFVKLQGTRGASDVRGNLSTGDVTVYVERAAAVSVMNELHRGERAGSVWRLVIDAIAGLLIVTSIIGFVLFLSLRFRMRVMLALIGVSIVVLGGLIAIVVP